MIPRWRKVWLIGGNGRRAGRTGYWIEWRDAGKRLRRRFPTRAIADRALRLVEAELNEWSRASSGVPWELVRERYMQSLSGLSRSHLNGLTLTIRLLEECCKPKSALDLDSATIADFVAALPGTDATRAKHIRHLSALLRWCVNSDHLPSNPMRAIRPPRLVRKVPRIPKPDEWAALLSKTADIRVEISDRQAWYVLILLGAVTGYRQSTLMKLRRDSFTFRRGKAIVAAIERKTRQEELRALPASVALLVQKRLDDIPGESLFPWGSHWRSKQWNALRAAAGFKFTFHDLRRASGTAWAIARVQAAGAQHLGHSRASVFAEFYGGATEVAEAAADLIRLPKLPPMPPYADPAIRRRSRAENAQPSQSAQSEGRSSASA